MRDFERIYNEYFTDIFRYILALSRNEAIAEEVTAEAFFKALKSIGKFDGRCDIRTWLCQIAKNTYFTYLRKNKQQIDEPELTLENTVADCIIDVQFDDKESALRIHKILHSMDEPYKEVFTLRVFGELQFLQIAELFGKTESWARVTYHRAKGKIAACMKEEDS
ncbi:MAG: RNA polymerase sigma factor [Oscillospiraceae bacterium]|nr:RNA polymerase sigma factor [Oscillospiraceae bacterium]